MVCDTDYLGRGDSLAAVALSVCQPLIAWVGRPTSWLHLPDITLKYVRSTMGKLPKVLLSIVWRLGIKETDLPTRTLLLDIDLVVGRDGQLRAVQVQRSR